MSQTNDHPVPIMGGKSSNLVADCSRKNCEAKPMLGKIEVKKDVHVLPKCGWVTPLLLGIVVGFSLGLIFMGLYFTFHALPLHQATLP